MPGFGVPPWLKYGFLGILVAISVTDMAVDMFYEVSCVQNGVPVPAVQVNGNAICLSTSGFRLLLGKVTLMKWTSRYEGGMALGKMEGNGTYTTAHGAVYAGEWADDQRTGLGTFTHADGLTYWRGIWERDELTGPNNEMTTQRSNIFNKLGPGGLPVVHSATFVGFTVNGFANGEGKIDFYSKDNKKDAIFSVEGTFVDGSLNSPHSDMHITFGSTCPEILRGKRVVLREWISKWHYGHQTVVGNLIFDHGRLQYSFSNGALTLLDSDLQRASSTVAESQKSINEPYFNAFQSAIEAVRAAEWHFIFNRVQLGPLVSLTSSDAQDTVFTSPITKSHGGGLQE